MLPENTSQISNKSRIQARKDKLRQEQEAIKLKFSKPIIDKRTKKYVEIMAEKSWFILLRFSLPIVV